MSRVTADHFLSGLVSSTARLDSSERRDYENQFSENYFGGVSEFVSCVFICAISRPQ
jgi:hypothetical protein